MTLRRWLAFIICPDLRDEVAALQSGNIKVVLENARLLDELAKPINVNPYMRPVPRSGIAGG